MDRMSGVSSVSRRSHSHDIDPADVEPRHLALKFSPPTLVLEYCRLSRHKLYHHRVRLKHLSPTSDVSKVVSKLLDRYSVFRSDKIPRAQLERLVSRLIARLASEGAPAAAPAAAPAPAPVPAPVPAPAPAPAPSGGGLLGDLPPLGGASSSGSGLGSQRAPAASSSDAGGVSSSAPAPRHGRRARGGLLGALRRRSAGEEDSNAGGSGSASPKASDTKPSSPPAPPASPPPAEKSPVKDTSASPVEDMGDLQRVSQLQLRMAKARMEIHFEDHQVKPGDEDYVYDKQVEFDSGEEDCSWDDDDDE